MALLCVFPGWRTAEVRAALSEADKNLKDLRHRTLVSVSA